MRNEQEQAECSDGPGRKWIGVQFECCAVYTRIYRNAARGAYEGHCPRCARPIRVKIGPGGTETRFFTAV